MLKASVNTTKALSSILYILDKLGGEWDMYATLKMLYFAECKHITRYGRTITGDVIVAMKYGPVPFFCYDEVKPKLFGNKNFELKEKSIIKAKKKPFSLELFSESDFECLNEAIKENSELSFGDIKSKSHDKSYDKTIREKGLNSKISLYDIASAHGAKEGFVNYLKEQDEVTDI
jgi:uncharacterized phage-associated protein